MILKKIGKVVLVRQKKDLIVVKIFLMLLKKYLKLKKILLLRLTMLVK